VLRDRQLVAFLLVTDVDRAKDFYCGRLGLPIRHEDDYAIVVDAGGTPLRLAIVEEVPEPMGTNVGWVVEDVNASVRELTAKGITFERFPGMDQDADGVWKPSPDSGGIAWFRDPDGNRLSLATA
jgi:catechol 2,3-dioxygenase-like lactoylglutathione lyase family enzyme